MKAPEGPADAIARAVEESHEGAALVRALVASGKAFPTVPLLPEPERPTAPGTCPDCDCADPTALHGLSDECECRCHGRAPTLETLCGVVGLPLFDGGE